MKKALKYFAILIGSLVLLIFIAWATGILTINKSYADLTPEQKAKVETPLQMDETTMAEVFKRNEKEVKILHMDAGVAKDIMSHSDLPCFFYIWDQGCKGCIANMPGLDSLAEKYKDKFHLIMVCSSDYIQIKSIREIVNKQHFIHHQFMLPLVNESDHRGAKRIQRFLDELFPGKNLKFNGWPTLLLVNKDRSLFFCGYESDKEGLIKKFISAN